MNNLRGAKIIYQESKATQPSHLYFLQKDENYCEAIVTSESGAKRKLNFNVDLSNYYKKTETYSKIEIDELLDSIEVTKPELDVLISENKLEPNRLYKITGVESWCFSQHLIKAIYLKAITNDTLESEGVGEFYTPKYNNSDSNLGIWKGELLANGMISSASYNIGDKVIWGNLFWENISGEIGNNLLVADLKVENYLSPDWELKIPSDNLSLYNTQFDEISYDINNDYINFRKDKLNNTYTLNINTLKSLQFLPMGYNYYLGGISLFQWGSSSIFNNNIEESLVINCNYKHVFKDNIILQKTIFNENNFLNVNITSNIFKSSSIIRNYLKSYAGFTIGGIINNNLDSSSIRDNKYYFEIRNNTLKNDSSISNNNDNNIIVLSKHTRITENSLDNDCFIGNNTFVEEGKEIDSNIKSINGNILKNNCSISDNIIKNGSKITDHILINYSTISGNNLDTESNIYNNQLIQNGKIDNNILTGHGRIYGNQLDRQSEITLCKLRISPVSSYATTMKNNRLFAGKIQNVDFGNIVNPVGSDPNNPAFGGNALSECIIENESIIKDLTFPNHGGVGLQFIKMNGASEFKNITVNNSIRNVDFVNTIFNETSDYSKLIEGSGNQTNGFTKTYVDGVLLQDKLDEKQNVLTNPITGTGSTNSLVKFLPDGTVGNSSIFDSGTNVGIGTLNPINKFTILGQDNNLPTLGSPSGKFGIFNGVSGNPTYGLLQGVLGAGSSYIQSQRVDGTAVAYDLLLQPSGGNVGIGKSTSITEKLDVNGYVKAIGYKTPTGTATQALTANGGVFDLNEKANIVDIPTKTSFTYDILVSNWTLVSGKYEAVISNAVILANSFVDVIPSNDHVDIVRAAQIYPSVLISAGSVKVYSKFLPSGTISVTVNVI